MLAPIVGLGTLARVREFGRGSGPVLSVYLSLDGCEPPAAACELQLRALIDRLTSRAYGRACVRIHELLCSLPVQASGTRGLALFATADGSRSAAIPLPEHVDPTVALGRVPWLEPLARLAGCAALAAERASARELPEPAYAPSGRAALRLSSL
jgi:hypothetical protein